VRLMNPVLCELPSENKKTLERQSDIHLTASFSGQPGQASTRLIKQEMMGWQWLQLNHMHIICTSL